MEIPVGKRGFCVGILVVGLIVGIDAFGLGVGTSDNLLGLYVGGTDGVRVVGLYEGCKVGIAEKRTTTYFINIITCKNKIII